MEDVNTKAQKESPGIESIADKEDRLRRVKERQTEERQRKLDELKAQALAAQKYREQKDEERRRRIEDMKARDADRRTAVEERKRAIEEAERDRREFLLRKNVDREAKFEKRRSSDRNSAVFAFGSSTPRLLDPGEMGAVSPSNWNWNHRRATSISNIAYSGQPLTRRSSERELGEGPKKRATSAGGDRQTDARPLSVHTPLVASSSGATRPARIDYEPYKRRAVTALPSPTAMSTSMYEVFNWGFANEAGGGSCWSSTPFRTGKRMQFSIAGPQINIDDPSPNNRSDNCSSGSGGVSQERHRKGRQQGVGGGGGGGSVGVVPVNDLTDSSPQTYRSVARRKTDLMPTLPSPRDGMQFGSRSSLTSASHTPRSPVDRSGRAMSMTRLDQLSKPIRRNGEHIRAIVEREKRMHLDANGEQQQFDDGTWGDTKRRMSRSMTHLAAATATATMTTAKRSSPSGVQKSASSVRVGGRNSVGGSRGGGGGGLKPAKSLCHLDGSGGPGFNRIITKVAQHFIRNGGNARGKEQAQSGLRSGEVTPGGTGSSRPTSAMSTSTITSTVSRRSVTTPRKPRPVSIAGTGMSVNGAVDLMTASCSSISSNKLQRERPPLPKQTNAPSPAAKRTPSLNSSRDSLMTRSVDLSKRTQPSAAAAAAVPKKTPVKAPVTPVQEQKPVVAAVAVVKQEEEEIVVVKEVAVEHPMEQVEGATEDDTPTPTNANVNDMFIEAEKQVAAIQKPEKIVKEIQNLEKQQESLDAVEPVSTTLEDAAVDMTASMMAKSKITTEEEAKAALAERRRLARVEAEKQAELERQRAEAAEEAERQRLMEEEERYRQLEVEANRLAQEARRAEEERLAQAIVEAQKKEEEDRVKREEENRQKQEQAEQERKAREEAEKQRLEMAEKLKKEEKEREERRKRVEAIMSRTRAKGSAPNTPVKSGEEEKSDGSQKEESEGDAEAEAKVDKDIPAGEATTTEPQSNANGDNNNHEVTTGFQANEQQGSNGVLGLKNGQQDTYEKSVTDKENALLGGFDNHFISEDDRPVETNNNNNNTTAMESAGENGFHKNGIDNNINSLDLSSQLIDENNAKNLAFSAEATTATVVLETTQVLESGADQLIDFGGDSMPHINNNANILNNNTTTTTASQLVTDLPLF